MKTKIYFTALVLSMIFVRISYGQGCMEASSDDGIQVMGYIQPQYSYYFFDEDGQGNTLHKANSFSFKRARLGVMGSIPYDISYYVLADFSPILNDGSAYLVDAFVTYAPFGKYAKFSIGQFKSPVSLELNTPCQALHTIRRSTVVNNLATPFRDMGIMILGSTDTLFGKKDLFSYQVAILNGSGLNQWDDNKYKDFAARLVISPWEWLRFGGSYRTGFQGIKVKDKIQGWRTRYGAELEFEFKNFLVQGEYLFGEDVGSAPSGGGGCGTKSISADEGEIFHRDGYFVQAMYMTPWNLQPVIKYESYNPHVSNTTSYTYLWVEDQDFIQNTLTFGLNYFLNEWTRIQINYLYNSEESGSVEFPNDAIMIQVQAIF